LISCAELKPFLVNDTSLDQTSINYDTDITLRL
jgi:hypothetical protein